MLKIGLTGGIASGKSEVGRLLATRGAYVVDADFVAHTVYQPETEGCALLIQAFGPEIVAEDGSIDRVRLAALVFADGAERRRLTDIVWPLTGQAVARLASEQEAAGVRVFVVEAPLLVEAGWVGFFDQVWLVRSRPDLVRQRLRQRGLAESEVESRLAAATDPSAAADGSDFVIENDDDLATLEEAVEALWRSLQGSAG